MGKEFRLDEKAKGYETETTNARWYSEPDIKEFIKRLKKKFDKSTSNIECPICENVLKCLKHANILKEKVYLDYGGFVEEIDKLAGDKLIKK